MARNPFLTVKLEGPFFKKDPRRTFRQNVRDFMDEVAALGEAEVKAGMRAGEGSRAPVSGGVQPARVSGHVVGRTRSLSGRRWAVSAVVSVSGHGLPRKQAIALKAAAANIERRQRPFARASSRINRIKKDLAEGLN